MTWFARAVVALRWPILLGWGAAVVAAFLYLPTIGEERGAPLEGLVAADSPAVHAELRSTRLFEVPVLTRTLVVQRDAEGLEPETEADALRAAVRVSSHREPRFQSIGLALPVTNTLEIAPESQETSTTVLTYLFFEPGAGLSDQTRTAESYADQFLSAGPGGFVGVTGAVPARLEQFDAIQGALPLVEVVTVALIALILTGTFRAPGAALASLAAAGAGFIVATRVTAWLAGVAHLTVPREIEPLMLVLLLGIMTDYTIFFLSGFRQRLREGEERLTAARGTASDYLPIVATAGAVVAAGTGVLVVGRLDFFRAFGPGMGLSALIGALAAMTLVPALLAVFGRALYWPSLRASSPAATLAASPRGERRARRIAVSRLRAALVAGGVVLALLAASTGLRELRLGFTLIPGLPSDAEARQAAEAAGKGFAPGIVAPTMAIYEAPGLARKRERLGRLEELVREQPGIAAVLGPTLRPPRVRLGAFVGDDGDAVRLILVLDSDPGGGPAIETLGRLQDAMPGILADAGLAGTRVSYAGDTALASDTVSAISGDLERIAAGALLANLLLLVLFLRSLVAPLYLLAASLLALGASMGIATYVFQGLLGQGEITYYVPFAAAVLLVSLGSDYNIFVAGRVWSEARRQPIRDAVAVAVPRAARAIAIASIALAASFAVLGLVPLRPFREFAFIMALGVLIDSFLVRSLLVPSLITLVGDHSRWPATRFKSHAGRASAEARG